MNVRLVLLTCRSLLRLDSTWDFFCCCLLISRFFSSFKFQLKCYCLWDEQDFFFFLCPCHEAWRVLVSQDQGWNPGPWQCKHRALITGTTGNSTDRAFINSLLPHPGFPGGSMVKNPPANAKDTGSIPGPRRCPGEGNGDPFQDSCLGNPKDRGAWRATVHGATKESSTTQWLSNNLPPHSLPH